MKCPKCGEYAKVTYTYNLNSHGYPLPVGNKEKGNLIRRRRKCELCGYSFDTLELPLNSKEDIHTLASIARVKHYSGPSGCYKKKG